MEKTLPPRGAALVLALAAALLLFRLGAPPLLGPDEPRYARVAVEMERRHDWVRPTLQGEPWLEKPALYYWLAGAAFRRLGETETAARLPSVLAGVALVGATLLFGARLYGRRSGLYAGVILATSLLAFGYGRAAAMDMLLAAAVTWAIGLLALRSTGIAGRAAAPAAFVAMGVAVLAKGPLGLLLPGLVSAGWFAATRDRRIVRAWLSPVGWLLFLAVAGPWYAAILRDQGRHFVDVFLLNHNLERFTSTVHRHPGPPFYYLPVLLAGLMPWSGLLPAALARMAPRRSRADLLAALWAGLPLVFFSLAGSKLPGDILPCLAPLALLMGRAAAGLAAGEPFPRGTGTRTVAVVGLAFGAVVATVPMVLRAQDDAAWLATVPLAVWAVVMAFLTARRLERDVAGGLTLMGLGAAGLLLLVALAAPPMLAARESGRALFAAAAGEEVLVWGARRSAWSSGYFYNEGRVREVAGEAEVRAAAAVRPVLVLAGPGERRALEGRSDLVTATRAEGHRGDALLRVRIR